MNDRPGTPYSENELWVINRIAIARAQFRIDETLTEFKSREMGHTDAESLIEAIRQRLHEDLAMMVAVKAAGGAGQ